MDTIEDRLTKVEADLTAIKTDLASIRGALDWAKVAASILVAVVLAAAAILIGLNRDTASKVDGLSAKLAEEFRAQRQDQSAQISALAAVITATKQQPAQVLLVPAPTQQAPASR